jgi:hypothetical protein
MSFWIAGATLASGVIGAAAGADSSRRAVNTQADIARAQLDSADKALDAQVKAGDELMAFNKQVYAEGKERQVGVDALNTKVINQQMGIAQENADRSKDSYDFYTQHGRPVVQQSLDDAKNFDSAEEITAARGRATADVAQAQANSQAQNQRSLQRMGINPNSGKFLAMQQRLQQGNSAQLAGAANQAEDSRRIGAIQLRQSASNMAQGIPGQAAQAGALGVNAGSAAGNANNQGATQNLALSGQALNSMAQGANVFGNAASGYSNLYGAASNSMNNLAQQGAQSQAGWGQLAGMGLSLFKPSGTGGGGAGRSATDLGMDDFTNYADGGKVHGPGTGTSDSVQAVNGDTGQRINLSNGEFIVSADVVRKLGTAHFEKLQEKYHTPVNVGRSA